MTNFFRNFLESRFSKIAVLIIIGVLSGKGIISSDMANIITTALNAPEVVETVVTSTPAKLPKELTALK